MKLHLAKILPHINLHGLGDVATALTEAGHTQAEVVEQIVALVDASIDWSMLGPWGSLADAVDGPVATALVTFVLGLRKHRERTPQAPG